MGADDLPEIPPAQVCREIGHDWVSEYDAEGQITGRVCSRCGAS